MWAEMSIGAGLFSVTVLILVGLVLLVKNRVTPIRDCDVQVNQNHVALGASHNLLWALVQQGIYLPSPCGGKGMCGQCKVTFTAGMNPPLPTETGQLTRKEISQGVRLACANRVRDGIALKIPDQLISAQRYQCKVVSTHNVATFLREIVFELQDSEGFAFAAGQFIMLEAPAYELSFQDIVVDAEYQGAWQQAGLLELQASNPSPTQRAYSLANAPNGEQLKLVVRIAVPPPTAPTGSPPGVVSSYIYSLQAGDTVQILGPFGEFHASDSDREMMLIAGGAGIAPMRSIIRDQLLNKSTTRRITFWYGARSVRDLCYTAEFNELAEKYPNFSWQVALSAVTASDDWQGLTGFIHDVVYESSLKTHPAPHQIEYYLCGPPVMSIAVIEMLEDLGVDRKGIYLDDFGA